MTPATLADALKNAKGGDTITLAPGDYGNVAFPFRSFSPGITIDASQARFSQIIARRVNGVQIKGGTVTGPRAQEFAVVVDFSQNVGVSNMKISGSRIGVAVSRSQGVDVIGNNFDGIRSDGVNIAMSNRVRVERNICRNFNPIQAVYASNGKLLKDGDHPDCVQAWSARGYAPTGDISVIGNVAEGFMQGIFFGNKGQGGYDRVVIRDNRMTLSAFNGIILWEARNSQVTGNTVNSVPGSTLKFYPFPKVRAWIQTTGSGLRVCGNQVQAWPSGEGTRRC